MIKPKLICIGSLKEEVYRKINKQYENKWQIIELEEARKTKASFTLQENTIDKIKKDEALRILKYIKQNDFVIVLSIEGKKVEIEQIKTLINENSKKGQNTVFIIGGSWGLDESIVKRGNLLWSFSKLTFPHQLMRIILLQEI